MFAIGAVAQRLQCLGLLSDSFFGLRCRNCPHAEPSPPFDMTCDGWQAALGLYANEAYLLKAVLFGLQHKNWGPRLETSMKRKIKLGCDKSPYQGRGNAVMLQSHDHQDKKSFAKEKVAQNIALFFWGGGFSVCEHDGSLTPSGRSAFGLAA